MERVIIIYLDVSDLQQDAVKKLKNDIKDYISEGFEFDENIFYEVGYIDNLKLIKLLIDSKDDAYSNILKVNESLKSWGVFHRLRRLDSMVPGEQAYRWEREFKV